MVNLQRSRAVRAGISISVLIAALLTLVGSVVARQYVTIERVNLNGTLETAGRAQRPVIDGAGNVVAYWSEATNIVANDTNNQPDIFVYDRSIDFVKRISVANGNVQSNGRSYPEISINQNGVFVAFASDATNLVTGDTNATTDIFVFDRNTNQITRVSLNSQSVQGNGASVKPVLSGDGNFVLFYSAASNFVAQPDANGADRDLYLYDRATRTTSLVNVSTAGARSNDEADDATADINSNGAIIAFESIGTNLVVGDANGRTDVFVRNRSTGITELVSVASTGGQGNGNSFQPSVNDDGRYVAFVSAADNLVVGDANGVNDIFLHDRQDKTTTRISVAADGTQANGNSRFPSVSNNGRFISFVSDASNLVPGDTNGLTDLFVHDTRTGQTTRINIRPDGTQANGATAPFSSISGNGDYVAFESVANNLVAGDTNNANDIFVAAGGPAAPTNLTAQAISTSQISLTWQDNTNDETNYIVQRTNNNGEFRDIATLAANTTSFVDTGLAACNTRSYRIAARNAFTQSVSNIATETTLGCPPGAFVLQMPAPNDVIVNVNNLLTFEWSPSREAVTYTLRLLNAAQTEIYSASFNAAQICTATVCAAPVAPEARAALVNGRYSYTVTATNAVGTTGATNNPAPFTVDDTRPPRAFTLQTPVNNERLRTVAALNTLTWQFNIDAATYDLVLQRLSNNPVRAAIGVVIDAKGLTGAADSDALTCTPQGCVYTVSAAQKAELSEGTYAWNVTAVGPGDGRSEAVNAAFIFSINTGDIELLVNGSFEAYNPNTKTPDDWTARDLSKDKIKCNKTNKQIAYDGLCAFEFKGITNDRAKLQQIIVDSDLVANDVLTLSVYAKRKAMLANARLKLRVNYATPGVKKGKLNVAIPAGTGDYTAFVGTLSVADAVKRIKLTLDYPGASGKVRMDAVSLTVKGTGALPVDLQTGGMEFFTPILPDSQ